VTLGPTDNDIAFYTAFGFLPLDAEICTEQVAELEIECANALASAYGSLTRMQELAVLSRCYLPMMGTATPVSADLANADILVGAARRALGIQPLVKPAKASVFSGQTSWHRDCYTGVRGVKFATYFGEDPIRFDVVPGSHLSSACGVVSHLLGDSHLLPWADVNLGILEKLSVPTHSISLRPGQILMFDIGIWHASHDPGMRIQWSVSYLAEPATDAERAGTVTYLGEFLRKPLSYPRADYPYFPASWEDGSDDCALATAFRDSGVLRDYLEQWGAGR
jgi:hypothetical protein